MRWKATIAYNGAHYCGWQVQPNGLSVQEVVENALAKIVKSPVGAVSSGRTDAGVHAKGQVFHFDCDLNMTGEQWRLALNSLLPDDMIIRKVEEADPNFHSRFDALWKRYDYVINMGEYDPFMKDLEFEYNKRLDVRAMRTAAGYLVGTHDFTSFNANSLEERPNQTRTIYPDEGASVVITPLEDGTWIDLNGNIYRFTSEQDVYDQNDAYYYYHGEPGNVRFMAPEAE
jgi:tRNA pseudouridine38-40 synthase